MEPQITPGSTITPENPEVPETSASAPVAQAAPPAVPQPAPATAQHTATPTPAPPAKDRVASIAPVNEPGERVVFTIKRHPIGIIGVYTMCAVVVIVAAALAFMILPGLAGDKYHLALLGALIFVVVTAVCAAFGLVASKVYWGNSWTLTTDSITQVNRVGLFKRESSQLSLENLEDVTAEQNGLFTHIFDYGVLRVETASESGKFMFPYCPKPNHYAQQVLDTREAFEQNRRREEA